MRKTVWFVCFMSLVLFSCKHKPRREELVMSFSEEVKKDVLSGMMTTLQQKVSEQGYAQAVGFCSTFAGEYGKSKREYWAQKAQEQLKATSFSFRRISLKNRNPNNFPNEAQRQILESWQKNNSAAPVGYQQDNNTIITLLPIRLSSPLCLGCHGKSSEIAAETLAEIRKRYPQDKAIGYSLNELRGAFVTEVSFPETK